MTLYKSVKKCYRQDTSYSTDNTFTGNTVLGNLERPQVPVPYKYHYQHGLYFDNSSNNTLTDNIVSGNMYAGIYLDRDSSNNSLAGNIALNNIFGFVIFGGYNNAFVANTACNNTNYDFAVQGLVTESDNICDKVYHVGYPIKCIPCRRS